MRIRNVYPGSEFFHPGSRVQGQKKAPDPGSGSATKSFIIFYPINCYWTLGNMIRNVYSESWIRIFFHPGSLIRIRNTAFYLKSYKLSLNFQFDSYISRIPIVLEFILSFLHDLKEPNNWNPWIFGSPDSLKPWICCVSVFAEPRIFWQNPRILSESDSPEFSNSLEIPGFSRIVSLDPPRLLPQSAHRVAMATFWRTSWW
jgi:hypothetical protein